MKNHVLMVLSNPVEGSEDEYNRWYSKTHLADVLKISGFIGAKRYRLAAQKFSMGWQYLAIYQFQSDDVNATVDALMAAAGTEAYTPLVWQGVLPHTGWGGSHTRQKAGFQVKCAPVAEHF